MDVYFLSAIIMAVLHHIPWQKEKNEEVKTYLSYNNNNRKQKITLSSDERVSYICDCYGCAS